MGVNNASTTRGRIRQPSRFSDKLDQSIPGLVAAGDPTVWSNALNNPALLVSLSAFLAAITGICAASISEFAPSSQEAHLYAGYDDQWKGDNALTRLGNIWKAIVWMMIGQVLMLASQVITRHLTFEADLDLVGHITGMTKSAEDHRYGRNIAAAIVEGGAVVSAGLVAAGQVSGPPRGWGDDIFAVVFFFVLSQVAFTAYTALFDFFFINKCEGNRDGSVAGAIRRVLPPQHRIKMPDGGDDLLIGNVAVAISYASMMVSYAMLISNAVYQSFELASFAVWAVGGGALLLFLRWFLDWAMVPHVDLDDKMASHFNWGFALVIGACQLSASRILSSLTASSCQDYKYTIGPGTPG